MTTPPPDAPETPPPTPTPAPAVHGDGLWDGPRVFDQHDGAPVTIETKAAYWDYLHRHGLRMKHQQESHTGHGPAPAPPPPAPAPRPTVAPMGQTEAHVYGAITAILSRYGLVESIWCEACAARGDLPGCRLRVTGTRVVLGCRCGVASYAAPTGTTDLRLTQLANTAVTALDQTAGSILTPAGPSFRPTTLLHDAESDLIRAYLRALRARSKEPRWFHRGCWNGDPFAEPLGMDIRAAHVVLVCPCRLLYGAASKSRH